MPQAAGSRLRSAVNRWDGRWASKSVGFEDLREPLECDLVALVGTAAVVPRVLSVLVRDASLAEVVAEQPVASVQVVVWSERGYPRSFAIAGSLALMSKPSYRLFGRFRARDRERVTERDWERSALLVPRLAPRRPELVSDGAGLPFSLAAFERPPAPLDPVDGAVVALIAHLDGLAAAGRASPVGSPDAGAPASGLDGWRLLASTDAEALFALGLPPRLLTVAMRREGRRQAWVCFASSASQPLRAARGTIRASAWHLDPAREVDPEDTVLRVLATEQAFASGQRAEGRVLAPDIFINESELVLRGFRHSAPGVPECCAQPRDPCSRRTAALAWRAPANRRRARA